MPDILEAVHQERLSGSTHYAYVVRDSRAYRNWKQIRELDEAGCAVRIKIEAHRFFTLAPDNLPASCHAPSGEPIPP